MFVKKKSEQIILENFATGRISTEDFWEEYKNNENLRNILINDRKRPKGFYVFNSESQKFEYKKEYEDLQYQLNPDNLLKKFDITKLDHKLELFVIVRRYFLYRHSKIQLYNKDEEMYLHLCRMLPNWLDKLDTQFMLGVYNSAPDELNQEQKIKWCKNRIKELFIYIKKPPQWIQESEWPIINGEPLVFVYQEGTSNDGKATYYFTDPTTYEQIVVEQYI